ncbi:MAG TPA: 16S rRNA (guanine(966)-N(2))-methyltransferase RsmD [Verrucomicrobia bacterium]|uniref:16S rRNA (Guanine(966)-N(2))-methyltransferase \|nr:16S rRNA (guanine(966)-N(2))-methyltransferase RsmD [Verrucomicrobiota bacterium]
MRIIGGTSAGATLKVPNGLGVRPTPDKVRLAIFNSIAGFTGGARVLEVFAGTGALGLECLSRGAESATFVELSARHARIMQANAKSIDVPPGQARFITGDAFVALAQLRSNGARFDLIMADPPYGDKNVNKRSESFAQRMLDNDNLPALLEPNGLFVLGHTKRDTLETPGPWVLKKTLKHGDTLIEILRLA